MKSCVGIECSKGDAEETTGKKDCTMRWVFEYLERFESEPFFPCERLVRVLRRDRGYGVG